MKELLEKSSLSKTIAHLVIPTTLSMIINVMFSMFNLYFLSQTGTTDQVAAFVLCLPILTILTNLSNVFGVGGASYISRQLGAGNLQIVKKTGSFCIFGCAAMGLVISLLMIIGMPWIVQVIGANTGTILGARSYLTIIAIGVLPIVLSSVLTFIIRAEGAAKIAMSGEILRTAVNALLDIVLILCLRWGIIGAALATVLGHLVECIFYWRYISGMKTVLSTSVQTFTLGEGVARNVLTLGVPITLINLIISASTVLLNRYLVPYGDEAVAVVGLCSKAQMLIFTLQMGVALGIQPLIGYFYGLRDFIQLEKVIKYTSIVNIIIGTVTSGIYMIVAPSILASFLNNKQAQALTGFVLRALILVGPVIGIIYTLQHALQTMGKIIPVVFYTLARQFLLYVPLLIILNRFFSFRGAVCAQPIADAASVLLVLVVYRHATSEN